MRISLEGLRKRLQLGTVLIYIEPNDEQLFDLQYLNKKYNLRIDEDVFWGFRYEPEGSAAIISANKIVKGLNYRSSVGCSVTDRILFLANVLSKEHYLADRPFDILTLDSVKEICEQDESSEFVVIKAGMLIEYRHGKVELIAESKDKSLYTVNPDTMNVSVDLRPFTEENRLFLVPELQIDKIYDIPSEPDNLFSTVNRNVLYKAKECAELTLDEAIAQLSQTLGKPVVIKGKPGKIDVFK